MTTTAILLPILLVSCLYTQVTCFGVLQTKRLTKTTALHVGAPPDVATGTSQELLTLLINHVRTKGIRGKNERIEQLMQELVDQQVKFDPSQCLNGPLFAVAYQSGPAPFWVRYSKLSPPKSINVEGQQYTLREDGGFDVINYGEFFGRAITVQARGVAYQEAEEEQAATKKASLFDSFFRNSLSSASLQCPVSFDVEVDKACCSVLNKSFALDISGTAKFTVLYADPTMRILTTKKSSLIEEKGFSAVQIRVDNLEPDFPILTFPL
jgi:hypothetical protein